MGSYEIYFHDVQFTENPETREFEAKDKVLTVRLSEGLLNDIEATPAHNMPIQKYVRMTLEQSL